MGSASGWESSDGWLLTALLLAGSCRLRSPEGLAELFGIADMLNHAIVVYEELHAVMARLAAEGLVIADGDATRVASEARGQLRAIVDASRNVLHAPAEVHAALRAGSLPKGRPSIGELALPSRAEFEAGFARYAPHG